MKLAPRATLLAALFAGSFLYPWLGASAQEMPAGPLTIIVPFPAGSMVTTVARLLASDLERELGRTVIIENHPGAGTVVATEHVLRAPHDGAMILMMSNSFFINRSLRPNLSYDPLTDFTPVGLAATLSHMLVAPPSFEGDFDDFIASAEAAGDRPIQFGAGTGTSNHLLAQEFANAAGIMTMHIPYAGAAPTYTDLMGGRLGFVFASMGDAKAGVEGGTMTPLATATSERLEWVPDLPTLLEKGISVKMSDAVYGAVIPSDVPAEIIARWQDAFQVALDNPQNRETILGWSLTPGSIDADAFGELIREYEEAASQIIRDLGITVED